jgi:hypothetical protein
LVAGKAITAVKTHASAADDLTDSADHRASSLPVPISCLVGPLACAAAPVPWHVL